MHACVQLMAHPPAVCCRGTRARAHAHARTRTRTVHSTVYVHLPFLARRALIDACCNALETDKAFQLLMQMRQQLGQEPNSSTYAALLESCARAGRVEQAFEVLAQMELLGARPTTASFNALLDACAESGRADRAIEVLGLMRRVGVRPNGGSYSALIDACARAGDLVCHAKATRGEALTSLSPTPHPHPHPGHTAPSCMRWSEAVHALVNPCSVSRGRHQRACVPRAACVRAQNNAMAALQEMLVVGERADTSSFSTLVELCGNQGQLDTALQLLGYVQRLGMPTTAPLYTALIGACLQCGQPRRALQAVQEMKGAGWVPDTNTYDALLLGCARHGEPVATLSSLLRQMQQEGVPRAGGLYLQLVEALAASSRHPDAVEIMNLLASSPAALQPGAPAVLATLRAVQPAEGKAVNESMRRLLQLLQEVLANQPAAAAAAAGSAASGIEPHHQHQTSSAAPTFDPTAAAPAAGTPQLPPMPPTVSSSFDSSASAASTVAAGGNDMMARMDAFAAADVDKLLGSSALG